MSTVVAEIADEAAVAKALDDRHFDTVVDWIAFTPDQIERDIRLFRGRTNQFIFIGSASAYQRPVGHYLITESTPLVNPYWQYSRDKIACEERLMAAYREEGFPDYDRAAVADLWGYTDCAGGEQLAEVVDGD